MEDSTIEKYEELKLTVIVFESEDVIVTSNPNGEIGLPDLPT